MRGKEMTKVDRLNLMKQRLQKLEGTEKNIKCPGVVRGLRREIRVLEDSVFIENGIRN